MPKGARRVGAWKCKDGERGHPIERLRVITRFGNFSAFNGYRFQDSDYSSVTCLDCGTFYRTKASYVDELPDATDAELGITSGN